MGEVGTLRGTGGVMSSCVPSGRTKPGICRGAARTPQGISVSQIKVSCPVCAAV